MNFTIHTRNALHSIVAIILTAVFCLSARMPGVTQESSDPTVGDESTVSLQETEATSASIPEADVVHFIQIPAPTIALPQETVPVEVEPAPLPIRVGVINGDQMQYMNLETYILGVVLAEMPARFDEEALKAQAVAARTYTLKNCIAGYKHPDGMVCTSSACCQAYKSPETYLAGGGKTASVNKVLEAVLATAGQVLVYNGKLIDAAYFSCSGGTTEDAVAVWGYDVPYLRSVESPGEADTSAYYREYLFTPEEFQKKMSVKLNDGPETWFGTVTYTEGGGVETIEIGGQFYKGTAVRSALKLRSTMFQIHVDNGGITVSVWGLGHRVGMSQYGADAMAKGGSTYREILSHYYPGTELLIFPFP